MKPSASETLPYSPRPMRFELTNIARLDGIALIALSHRMRELAHATEQHPGLVERTDRSRRKLDAMMLGIVDSQLTLNQTDASVLPLVTYILVLALHGPSIRLLSLTERTVELLDDRELMPYVRLGRRLVMREYVRQPQKCGGYAELLAREPI